MSLNDAALQQFKGSNDLMEYYKIELRLITEMLGTVARNQEMYDYHARTKAAKEAERYGNPLTEEQIALEALLGVVSPGFSRVVLC